MKYFTNGIRFFVLSLLVVASTGFVCRQEFAGKQEARGIWLSRWEYTTNLNSSDPEVQQAKIIAAMDLAAKEKFNFILFQVRGQCDAFYPSELEPWAKELTGTLGQDPGWDPLQFAIDQAHARRLELHVWLNTFTCWKGEIPPEPCQPSHILHLHPEWICADAAGKPMELSSHYVTLSPGIPEVREHVHEVAMDIVRRYDIDGVHFDYIRYPENSNQLGYSHDSISVARFNSPQTNSRRLNWDDWQREQINTFVREFYDAANKAKPMLKISAAVIGKYDWSSWNGYHVVYQDAARWMEEGKMDFIAPMIYWRRNHPSAPFGKIAREWIERQSYGRLVFPGMAVYKLNNPQWAPNEIEGQVSMVRRLAGKGLVFFSYTGLEQLAASGNQRSFSFLANVPPMRWKDSVPPNPPTNLRIERIDADEITLSWHPPQKSLDGDGAEYYNIYRTVKSAIDSSSARHLLAITSHNEPIFTDTRLAPGKTYTYAVAALDDGDNESLLSNRIKAAMPAVALKMRADSVRAD